MNNRLTTAFVDVGGTLWPNTQPFTLEQRAERVERLADVLRPERLEVARVAALIEVIEATPLLGADESRDAWVARVLAANGVDVDLPTARSARQAIRDSFAGYLAPFAGAGAMLAGLKRLGLCSVVLSNTAFRDRELYRADFEALGWAEFVDDYVTSVEAGCSKPDERMFRLALEVASAIPERCVMIGDSETSDIAPAAALGMQTILVAIEEPFPTASSASAAVGSLDQIIPVLQARVGD